MKKNIIKFIIGAILLLLGGYVYKYLTSRCFGSSLECLEKVEKAIASNDLFAFKINVNTSKIINDFEWEVRCAHCSGGVQIPEKWSKEQSENFKDLVNEELKLSFENQLENKSVPFQILGEIPVNRKIEVSGETERGFVDIMVSSLFGEYKVPATITLRFQHQLLSPVLIAIFDSQIATRREIAKDLYKKYYLYPQIEKVNKLISIKPYEIVRMCSEESEVRCLNGQYHINRKIHNKSKKDIRSVEYFMYPGELANFPRIGDRFVYDSDILVNQIKDIREKDIWSYDIRKRRDYYDSPWWNRGITNSHIYIKSVTFSDGEKIVVDENKYLEMKDSWPPLKEVISFGIENSLIRAEELATWDLEAIN